LGLGPTTTPTPTPTPTPILISKLTYLKNYITNYKKTEIYNFK